MSSPVSSLTASRSSSPEPPVQPDHFYGTDPLHLPPSPDSEGKAHLSPEDDPLAHRGIPVFKPTMHEFADFEGYMNRVESWGRRSGIVKVVPPKEWRDALPDVKPQLAGVKIKSPIEQFMRGRAGLFRQENMEKRKLMSVREWAELCAKDEFRAPGVDQVGVHNNPSAQTSLRSRRKKPKGKEKEEEVKPEPVEDVAMASPPNSASPDPEDAKPEDTKPEGSKARNRRVERADKDTSFLDTFSPHTDWLPPGTAAADYTPEFCAKLERAFWRNCGLGKPAWYGADTMGSLYTDETTAWNVAHLPSTLSRLLPPAQGLPGVNTPYLYFGMWRATFAWHVEDMDLFSINYIHFGAPKFWYAVPQARAGALEDTMRGYFPKDTSQCPQFLRHKSFLASPTLLAQSAVRPNHLVQHAGEFVITYPRGYHAGFNLGLNCAESVNFALDSWLDEGRKAAVCKCVDFSVRIDVDRLLEDRRIEALEKTDPAAAARARAKRDGVDSDETMILPAIETKPEPLPGVAVAPTKPRSPRKRKPTAPFEPDSAPKRPRTVSASTSAHPSSHAHLPKPSAASSSSHTHPPAAPKLTLKLGPRPPPPGEETFPCCLCVDPSTTGLARVHDLPVAWREVGPAARIHFPASTGGKGVWMAHEACAFVLPETWVDEINGERLVFGVDGIVRGRWSLKCSSCVRARPRAHGALIQCTKGKCPKAFHVNCAKAGREAGIAYTVLREVEKEVVLLEPAPTVDSNASADPDAQAEPNLRVLKVIKKIEVEALCAQHNPVIVAERRASKQEGLRADILALPPLSRVKVRVSSGVFEVTLMRVLEEKGSVEVLWDQSEVRELKWGAIILGQTNLPTMAMPATTDIKGATSASSRPRTIAPYPAPTPDAHNYYQYAAAAAAPAPARPPNTIILPATASSSSAPQRFPANATASSSNQHNQTNPVTSQPNSATQAHNPYNVFKYEYWKYPGGAYPGAPGSAQNSAQNTYNASAGAQTVTNVTNASTSSTTAASGSTGSNNPAASTNGTTVASQHIPGTHYVNQYYTGPQPWSSQYYRPPPAFYPQVQFQQAHPGSQGQKTAPALPQQRAASVSVQQQRQQQSVIGQSSASPAPAALNPTGSTPTPNPTAAPTPSPTAASTPNLIAAPTPNPIAAPQPNPIVAQPTPQPLTPTAPAPAADPMQVDVQPVSA